MFLAPIIHVTLIERFVLVWGTHLTPWNEDLTLGWINKGKNVAKNFEFVWLNFPKSPRSILGFRLNVKFIWKTAKSLDSTGFSLYMLYGFLKPLYSYSSSNFTAICLSLGLISGCLIRFKGWKWYFDFTWSYLELCKIQQGLTLLSESIH